MNETQVHSTKNKRNQLPLLQARIKLNSRAFRKPNQSVLQQQLQATTKMAMLEENFERTFARSQRENSEGSDIDYSAFDELDSSIKVLGFNKQDKSWQNWHGDE